MKNIILVLITIFCIPCLTSKVWAWKNAGDLLSACLGKKGDDDITRTAMELNCKAYIQGVMIGHATAANLSYIKPQWCGPPPKVLSPLARRAWTWVCEWYVIGKKEGYYYSNRVGKGKRLYCLPNVISLGTAVQVFVLAVMEMPNLEKDNSAVAVLVSLIKEYPCN